MDILLEQYPTDGMDGACAFCNREVPTRGHHVVPRCKGGRDIAPTCPFVPSLALQATGRSVLSDATQPEPNQPTLPVI
jgi:hypothetical protein